MNSTTPRPNTAVRLLVLGAVVVVLLGFAAAVGISNALHSSHVTPGGNTPSDYCTLVQTKSMTEMVDVAATTPDYTDTVLAMMPSDGPPEYDVATNLATLRSELADHDFTTAKATAMVLDDQTALVCGG